MKKITLLCVFLIACFGWQGYAQTTPVCGGKFYDTGGPTGDFQDNEDYTVTIMPTVPGDLVTATFTFVDNTSYDELKVDIGDGNGFVLVPYDIDPANDPPVSYTSVATDGSLVFEFVSSSVTPNPGWEADITCNPPPTCPQPIALEVTNVLASSADLGWTETGAATTWDVHVVPAGDPAPDATTTPSDAGVTANPYSKTGLTAQTDYDFYIRADCGSGDLSAWNGPVSFGTLCAAVVAPITDDVEAHTGTTTLSDSNCWTTVPDGSSSSDYDWNIEDNGSTPSTSTGPSGANSGNNYFYVEASNGSDGDVAELYSPLVDVSGLTAPAMEFYYHMYGQSMGDLHVDVFDGTTWTNDVVVISGEQQTDDTDPWLSKLVDLSVYSGTIQVRFRAIRSTDYYGDIALDDLSVIEMPACLDPTSLSATNIASDAADLGWTETGAATTWDVHVVPAGDPAPDATTTPSDAGVTANPYSKTGLTPITAYEFYVRADCGSGDLSAWSGPFAFTTTCVAEVAPWTEDFSNAGTIPDCWAQGATNGKDWEFDDSAGSNHIGDNGTMLGSTDSGGYFAWVDDSGSGDMGITLLSPFIDVSGLTVPELTFYRISHNEGNDNVDFSVDVWDGSAWTEDVYFSNTNSLNGGWEKVIVDLSTLTITGDIQIRFVIDENNGTDFYDDVAIDDVSVHEQPTCPQPITLTVANITSAGAELGWTEGGSATTWDIEVVPAGTTPTGTPTDVGVTSNPYVKTGLTANTDYEFYVRADCGGGDLSNWSGPVAFTTLCGAVSTPWLEDVESHGATTSLTDSNCWATTPDGTTNSYDWNIDDNGSTPSASTGPSGANSGTNYFYVESSYGSAGDEAELYSPSIDISTMATPTLEFYYHMYGDDIGELRVDVHDGTAWVNDVEVIIGEQQTSSSDPWLSKTVDISTYSGAIQIRFRAVSVSTDLNGDIAIDDISIKELLPTPTDLMAINIQQTAADLTWTENGTATEWEIEHGPVGFAQGSGTLISDNDGTLGESLSGLSPATVYDFYVRAIDSNGNLGAWAGPHTFTTACDALSSFPYEESFEDTSQYRVCWTDEIESGEEEWEFVTANQNASIAPRTGDLMAEFGTTNPTGDVTKFVTPALDLSSVTNPTLTFYYANVAWMGDIDELRVYYKTSATGTWTQIGMDYTAENTSWTEVTLQLPNASSDYYVAFEGTSNYGRGLNVDDVWIGASPITCEAPTNLAEVNVESDAVEVSWDAVTNAANGYEWFVFTPGADPATDTPVDTGTVPSGTTSVTVTGLTPDTSYDFYVAADCGASDGMSTLAGPLPFTTKKFGVSDQVFEGFTYYPNPVSNTLSLEAAQEIEQVVVYNLLGQEVLKTKPNSFASNLEFHSLQSGTYLMEVTIDGTIGVFRIIKE